MRHALLALLLVCGTAQAALHGVPGPTGGALSGDSSNTTATATGGSASDTLADRFATTMNLKNDFGAAGDGSTDDLTAMNNGIAWLNAANRRALIISSGIYQLSAEPNALTCTDCAIVVLGKSTAFLRFTAGAGSAGTFFTVGTAGTTANRVTISGLRLVHQNTPGAARPSFAAVNVNDLDVRDIYVQGIESFIKAGTSTTKAQRVRITDIEGGYDETLNGKIVWLDWAIDFESTNVRLFGAGTPGAGGVSFYIVPTGAGNFVDTVHATNTQIYQNSTGQDYGVIIDNTTAKVVNVWFTDCLFDFTDVAAFTLQATAGANDLKNIWFTSGRLAAGGGNAVVINNAGTGVWNGIRINSSLLSYRTSPALTIAGTQQIGGIEITDNIVRHDSNDAISAAVTAASGGWAFSRNKIIPFSAAETAPTYAVQTTADVDNFTAVGNSAVVGTGFFNHFAYASPSANRVTCTNIPATDTCVLGPLSASTGTFSGLVTGTAGATLNGATVAINASSNNSTNINTGSSTGTATIGGGSGNVTIRGTVNMNASQNSTTNIGTGTTTSAVSIGGGSNTVAINTNDWGITAAGVVTGINSIALTDGLAISATDPTVSSGFGTSPSVAGNGAIAFTVNVGTGGAATGGVLTMPAAATGWNCHVDNRTGVAANRADQRTVQTATTTTTVTVQNQTVSTGAALAWTASDILALSCFAY